MKKLLLAVVMMAGITIANAQTAGTNTLGLGFNSRTEKIEYNNQQSYESTNRSFSIGYGRFFRDNERMGLELSYGVNEIDHNPLEETSKSYGGRLSYQKYFPLLKKFYAFGGGRGGYTYSSNDYNTSTSGSDNSFDSYYVGAYGGVTWFLSKRFAFEADLLAADISYSKGTFSNDDRKHTSTNFNLSSSGAINNLGFKIYLLF